MSQLKTLSYRPSHIHAHNVTHLNLQQFVQVYCKTNVYYIIMFNEFELIKFPGCLISRIL